MAHPHLNLFAGPEAPEKPPVLHRERRPPVLPPLSRNHLPAGEPGDQLHPVAESQNRHPELDEFLGRERGAFVVHRVGSPREDDPLGVPLPDPLDRTIRRVNLGVDVGLPHPPCDQLGELGAIVEDEDAVVVGHGPNGVNREQ